MAKAAHFSEDPPQGKRVVFGIAAIPILSALLFLIFRDEYPQIKSCLSRLSLGAVLVLLALGILYELTDAKIMQVMVRRTLPSFSFSEAVEVTYLGLFGTIAVFIASAPIQSYYLHRKGEKVGSTIGKFGVSYVLYRASALVYAGVMLLWMGEWLRKGSPQLLPYILAAFGVSLLVIVGMVLLCAWGKMRDLALCLLGHLPQKETWARRAETLRVQVVALYSESWELLHARRVLYQVALLNGLKLFILFCIPYVCQIALDLGGVLTLTETQALSAVMCLITHVLPGVAGMGPPEFAFLLLFSPHLQKNTMSVLLLYRIVTYYAQFLISIVVFFRFFWQSSKGTG